MSRQLALFNSPWLSDVVHEHLGHVTREVERTRHADINDVEPVVKEFGKRFQIVPIVLRAAALWDLVPTSVRVPSHRLLLTTVA